MIVCAGNRHRSGVADVLDHAGCDNGTLALHEARDRGYCADGTGIGESQVGSHVRIGHELSIPCTDDEAVVLVIELPERHLVGLFQYRHQ